MNAQNTVEPPRDELAEIIAVGCVLKNPAAIDDLRTFISTPAMFTLDEPAAVFRAMCSLDDAGKPAEPALIVSELSKMGLLEGREVLPILKGMRDACPSALTAPLYAANIAEMHVDRAALSLCYQVSKDITEQNGNAATHLDALQTGAARIAQDGFTNAGVLASDIVDDVARSITEPMGVEDGVLSTGFPELDQQLAGGMKRKQLIGIGAAGKIGKTSLAVNIVSHVALVQEAPVAFLSHEMSAAELVELFLISNCEIPREVLVAGNLPDHKIRRREQVLAAIKSSRIAIDDAPPKTLQGTRSKLRLLQRVYKIKLAVVDYFQLVVDDTDARTKRYEKLVELSCGLKKIAVDLDIPVIVLAQLNSNPQDENRAPRVTDVEECKKLYKDANVMLLLDRPYERNRYNGDWVERNPGQENVGFIDVAAIRSGAPGVIRANFYGAIHRWKTQGHGVAGNGSEETF